MTRTVFAMAVAAPLILAVSGGLQAALIAPLGSAVTADQSNVTPVYWHHVLSPRHGTTEPDVKLSKTRR